MENSKKIGDEVNKIQEELNLIRKKAYTVLDAIPASTLLIVEDASKRLGKLRAVLEDFDYVFAHYSRLMGALEKMDPQTIKKSAELIGYIHQGLMEAKREEECG